jgi:hypothetical protein
VNHEDFVMSSSRIRVEMHTLEEVQVKLFFKKKTFMKVLDEPYQMYSMLKKVIIF